MKTVFEGAKVNQVAWAHRWEAATAVWLCRVCGGGVMPLDPPDRVGRLVWFYAECSRCGLFYACPDGRSMAVADLKPRPRDQAASQPQPRS